MSGSEFRTPSATDVLDALRGSIAVLDSNAVIVAVNERWKRFARDHGCSDEAFYVGSNYLAVCEKALAQGEDASLGELIRGLRRLILGEEAELSIDYRCDSPAEARWYQLTATRFESGDGGAVLYHEDITARVRADAELHRAKEAVEAAGRELAEVVIRERMLGRIDPLTGALNRRRFFEVAEYEVTVAERYRQQLSIILFDLDGFKAINDTIGHQAGDELLQGVVRVVRAHLRPSDMLARYGGDEFVVLLPQTRANEAAVIAERMRADIAEQSIATANGAIVSAQISAGIAQFLGPGDLLDAIIRRADSALYKAKKEGRNRISICF